VENQWFAFFGKLRRKARLMECVKAKHYLDELPVTIEIASYNAGFSLPVYWKFIPEIDV
jgi:hypothetical protein